MGKTLALVLTAAVGCGIAFQAPINSRLGRAIGTFPAASVSFLVGTAILVAIAFSFGGGFGKVVSEPLPWHYFIGGLLGAAYVTIVLVTVRTLGAGAVTAATISGQLTASIVIDQMGALGLPHNPITPLRLLGVVLLVSGTLLVAVTH